MTLASPLKYKVITCRAIDTETTCMLSALPNRSLNFLFETLLPCITTELWLPAQLLPRYHTFGPGIAAESQLDQQLVAARE